MKKFFPVFLASVVALSGGAFGAGTRASSSIELDTMPSKRVYSNVNYSKYATHSTSSNYDVKDAGDLYYAQPVNRSALYRQYDASKTTNVRTTRSETLRTELKRKYFLAHPFFQPLQYKFGSITDGAYVHNGYNAKFHGAGTTLYYDDGVALNSFGDLSGKWNSNAFAIKEDLSFGITDRLALMGMLRYDSTKEKFEWSESLPDKVNSNGLNLWGLGLQGRIVDSQDWIAMASFYFEHQKDVANDYILELKAGYKVGHSTVYGVARGWMVDMDGDAYGNYVTDSDRGLFFAYKTDAENAFYGEFGLGDFSVLAEDWTLNAEALFGYYDWHNQISGKLAFGWQPNDWFALNLYGKYVLYDSANNKDVDVYFWERGTYLDAEKTKPVPGLVPMGLAELSDYSEYSIGLQAMFMF